MSCIVSTMVPVAVYRGIPAKRRYFMVRREYWYYK